MEEIKFRAWNKEERRMEYDFSIHSSSGEIEDSIGKERTWIPMQYTTLKDKNGKEIYHKDKVKAFGIIITVEKHNGAFGYWHNDMFISFAGNHNFAIKNNKSDKIEVIGNVYETN